MYSFSKRRMKSYLLLGKDTSAVVEKKVEEFQLNSVADPGGLTRPWHPSVLAIEFGPSRTK